MEHFRLTGLWTPLSRRQKKRVEREYTRCVRTAAGECGNGLSPKVERFCQENFSDWQRHVSRMQFLLARQVGLFYLANGRLPRRERAPEVFLANFVSRARTIRLTRKSLRHLDRNVPGWRVDHEELQSIHLLQMLHVEESFQE